MRFIPKSYTPPHAFVSPKALSIVLDIFRKLPNETIGISTRQIYEKSQEYNEYTDLPRVPNLKTFFADPPRNKKGKPVTLPMPPHPEHPVRSMRYLKLCVLQGLSNEQYIEKFHSTRPPVGIEKKILMEQSAKANRRNAMRILNGLEPVAPRKSVIQEWAWRRKADPIWRGVMSETEYDAMQERLEQKLESARVAASNQKP